MERTKGKKKNYWKGKVLPNLRQQHVYKPIKKKVIEFSNNPNMINHRYLSKEFVTLPISTTAKGMYPVLCSKSDFIKTKSFQISQENIGVLTGIKDRRTIVKAITELKSAKLVKLKKIENERTYFIYNVEFIRKAEIEEWKGGYYRFYTCIIESGIWAQLTPRAQVFYQAIRSFAVHDDVDYQDWLEEGSASNTDETFKEWYINRPYDIYLGQITKLCREANISSNHISDVLLQLKQYRLIRKIDGYYRVYLKSQLEDEDKPSGEVEYFL